MTNTLKFALAFVVAAISGILLNLPAHAIDSAEKAQIESIIREYLLKNPEIIPEMQEIYKLKQQTEQAAIQQKTLNEKAEIIFASKFQKEIGAKNAKYKVVEFFDYNCPYCQRAMIDMKKVIEKNPDVKFIIKEWPVLGQNSFEAHNVSLAFGNLMPEKYDEFHTKLLEQKGQKGKKRAIELALTLGADEKLLREEMEKPYIMEALRENNAIASDLGITGTPSYVIGDEVLFGAVGSEQINLRIEALRK